jgi:hypothetical protein
MFSSSEPVLLILARLLLNLISNCSSGQSTLSDWYKKQYEKIQDKLLEVE